MAKLNILVLNAGSSTHKLALFRMGKEDLLEPLWRGGIDRGGDCLHVIARVGEEPVFEKVYKIEEIALALASVLATIWNGKDAPLVGPEEIVGIGHRVVHGGPYYLSPTLITDEVKERIESFLPLAPLHNRANLDGILLMERLFPHVKQVAVFDTSFHRTLPKKAKTYPLPKQWREMGIERYGFHGISHHYCSERVTTLLGGKQPKIINCHLGNGVSLCAIEKGESRETTMGFTPLEGAMMGTRCGSVDPSISLFLQREKGLSPEEIARGYNSASGLKGIADESDMRTLLLREDPEAIFALEMYTYRIRGYIGMLAATLGGVEVLSFTGGIGEHASRVRSMICEGLSFLGVQLDEEKNLLCKGEQEIGRENSPLKIWVIQTREEWMIARSMLYTS